MNRFIAEDRFQAPLTEKPEGDLIFSIRANWNDAAQCRAELRSRGWTDRHIDTEVDRSARWAERAAKLQAERDRELEELRRKNRAAEQERRRWWLTEASRV